MLKSGLPPHKTTPQHCTVENDNKQSISVWHLMGFGDPFCLFGLQQSRTTFPTTSNSTLVSSALTLSPKGSIMVMGGRDQFLEVPASTAGRQMFGNSVSWIDWLCCFRFQEG
jgi:hypothetical protein